MKRGVKKVDDSITVYCGDARVEAEDPSDLGRNTVVSDAVKKFALEAKAGDPYGERVFVNCLAQGVVIVEVEGNAEEWVCGKLNIVSRYLKAGRRRTNGWVSALSTVWLVLCGGAFVEAMNYVFLGHPAQADLYRVLSIGDSYFRWGATAIVMTLAARRTTAASLLQAGSHGQCISVRGLFSGAISQG
jgi:hypothetical protein